MCHFQIRPRNDLGLLSYLARNEHSLHFGSAIVCLLCSLIVFVYFSIHNNIQHGDKGQDECVDLLFLGVIRSSKKPSMAHWNHASDFLHQLKEPHYVHAASNYFSVFI
jgi:hypothetical protein